MTNRQTTTTDFNSPRSWLMGKLAAQQGHSTPAQHWQPDVGDIHGTLRAQQAAFSRAHDILQEMVSPCRQHKSQKGWMVFSFFYKIDHICSWIPGVLKHHTTIHGFHQKSDVILIFVLYIKSFFSLLLLLCLFSLLLIFSHWIVMCLG